MMVLDDEPIFENCLIKSTKKNVVSPSASAAGQSVGEQQELPLQTSFPNLATDTMVELNNEEPDTDSTTYVSIDSKQQPIQEALENSPDLSPSIPSEETNILEMNIEELDNEDLKEFDPPLTLENILPSEKESITLKKPNQVYFELYKNARNKAKQAKKSLLLAFLEAKNIKKTYMLENLHELSDEDSDLDAEIDDVSESDLEAL